MEKSYKAALFDLDGVVFDTEPQYSLFWGSECRRYLPEEDGLEHQIKGQTLVQIYEKYFSGELEKEREHITKRLYEFEAKMNFDYVSGFESFISSLRKRGIKTALVTSSNREKMGAVYKKRPEFAHLFDTILTSEDFSESKPSPDCYLRAAERLSLDSDDCVVFEDSFNGLRSGRAAGMTVVGLSTTNSREEIAPLCDVVINDYIGFNI
ncbi:MAG: HAD family phosphatase [Prevotella sp.]|uniref:HAD family hydrolase n=1 Tax=Prevotella sp. TaxID=59823 RepID=UPI002A2F5C1E|nr:HAD family phosphatase [Prevotella sp.]MDD7318221.1 HAD family phosphatase [Prevotellaceae bacterium]MDY4020890.1 HAD family phosphatase [Prevotella sp.]